MDKTEFEELQERREEPYKSMGSSGIEKPRKKLLFIPRCRPGDGTGHLERCAALAKGLGSGAYILSSFGGEKIEEYFSSHSSGRIERESRFIADLSDWCKDDLIVVDRRSTSIEELRMIAEHGIPIGIDEGGAARKYFAYLVDTLPMLASNKSMLPNAVSVHAGDKKKRTDGFDYPFKKFLISFGGEDKADLSYRILASLLDHGIAEPRDITLIEGPLFTRHVWPDGVNVVRHAKSLDDYIRTADCLVTHFGLTCFEAFAIGTPVILFNPTRYHRALSVASVIPEIGIGKPDIRKLRRLLSDRSAFDSELAAQRSYIDANCKPLGSILSALRPHNSGECPLCGNRFNPAVARFKLRSYMKCGHCNSIYLVDFSSMRKNYDRDYFFDEYEKQYGKTYIDDFQNIKLMGTDRFRVIDSMLKKRGRSLYEIGCAYGPFLSACLDAGIAATGCDISADACAFVTEKLGVECDTLDFENADDTHQSLSKKYDAVSLWYVIEHFRHPDLALKRINRMLVKGGVLAFSTPHAKGISGRSDLVRFLEASPSDHYTVWDVRSARKALARFGFAIKTIRITGHHPERFPIVKKSRVKGKSLHSVLKLWSMLFGLGDTFEIYAVKERDL
jgi:2-polyprenyl-3-methyl-5-hydroxy-6-metoxy-1,4-benzoquinol methylase/spore coat polysaccharide biosynthesis predicted glycosyltransferase SpsG